MKANSNSESTILVNEQSEVFVVHSESEPMCRIPPRQEPLEQAFVLAFDALFSKQPSSEKLKTLGADLRQGMIRLPVFGQELTVNLANREVLVGNKGRAKCKVALLVLHYLCADNTDLDAREVSLNHFADCRTYYSVFEKRIISRFLATIGRTREQFEQSSEHLYGIRTTGVGAAYRFDILPRVPIIVVRYDEDDEFGPSANIIYRADAGYLLPAEDRIVAAELLLDAMSGKPLEEGSKD